MATSFSFSSQPIDYRQSRDVVVGWIRPQQNLVHRPLSSNSPTSRYTPYPQPQPRPQHRASPHAHLTTSQPLHLVSSTSRFNPRSPTRPLFSHNPTQLQTSPGSRERNRLRSSIPPAPPLIPLGSYRPTGQTSLTRPASHFHARPQTQPQAYAITDSHPHGHSHARAHSQSQPFPHARWRSQQQPQLHLDKQAQSQAPGRHTATSSKSPTSTVSNPSTTASSAPTAQTASATSTVSMHATTSSTLNASTTSATSSNPTISSAPPQSEPHSSLNPHPVPQVGQTVPTQSSFLCVFQYKTERVQAIGADDLATTLQSLPCIFPALAAYRPEEVTLYGIIPQGQVRSPPVSPAATGDPASTGTSLPTPPTITTTTTTTTPTTTTNTSKSLCFRMTPGLYAELRKAHRSVYSDPSDIRDENRIQKDSLQQQNKQKHEGVMRAIPWFIVVTTEQVSGTETRREMVRPQDGGSGGDGNDGNKAGEKMEMKLHPGLGGSGKDGKEKGASRQDQDGKKGSNDGSKQRMGRVGEFDRVAEREQQAEHRSSAPSPALPVRAQQPMPPSSESRACAPVELDRSLQEDKPIQVQPESMHIDSDKHSRDEDDPLDLVPPKGYTDRAEALEALRGLSLLWKKSPAREIVPLAEDKAGEDTQREVECQSDDAGDGVGIGSGKKVDVEPKTAVETSSAMAVDDQLRPESQAALRRSQSPTSPAAIIAVEPVVKQEDKTPPATPLKCMTTDQITPPQPPVLYKINRKNTIILTASSGKNTTSADPFTIDVHLRELVNPAPTFHMKPDPKPKKREKKKAPQQSSTVVLPMSDRTNLPYRPMIKMSKSEKRLQASLQAAFGGRGLA